MRLLAAMMVLVACRQPGAATNADASTPGSTKPDASTIVPIDARPSDGPIAETTRLGLNDISFLLQLPADPTNTTTFAKMTGFANDVDLVPRQVFAQIDFAGGDVTNAYEQFHVVAIRFDLCDRAVVGPCDVAADGQLRLSLQPLLATTPTQAADVALHALYRIPAADMASVITELRALARLRGLDRTTPLIVNTLLGATTTTEYSTRLAALVATYAQSTQLIRLTVMDQPASLPASEWHASGLGLTSGTFQFFVIPTLPSGTQGQLQDFYVEADVGTPATYIVDPVADAPTGFATALDNHLFLNGTDADRAQALTGLMAALDPTATTSQTIQCVGCHVSTDLSVLRAGEAGVDPSAIPGRYTSTHDLSIAAGASATDNLSVRCFGWRADVPEISQRTANDTAMILDEIEARFPVP